MPVTEDAPSYDPLAKYLEPSAGERVKAFFSSAEGRGWGLLVVALMVGTAILYGRSLWNPLVFDDTNVLNDARLRSISSSLLEPGVRWLTYGTFGITYRLVGTDWFWYRLGNLGIHSLTAVLLFIFFFRLLQLVIPQAGADRRSQNRTLAFFGAALFALHPVAVYGVAYLVERSVLLATFFSVAALLCHTEGVVRQSSRWLFSSAALYVLAVSSKEHAVMLPGVAIAISWLLNKPSFSSRKFRLPLLISVGAAIVIGTIGFLHFRHLVGTPAEPTAYEIISQLERRGLGPTFENAYPLSIISQGHLFFQYLLVWLVPYVGWMSIDVRQPFAMHPFVWPQTAGFVAFIVYGVIAVRLLTQGGRRGLAGLGMIFPWILFLVEFTTVRIAEIFVLYRSYLWMSGLPIVLIAILSSARQRTIVIGGVAACLALFPIAWNRLDTFSDETKLWSDAIRNNAGKKDQGAERAYNKRGMAHSQAGRYDEAIDDFKRGHAVHSTKPGYANVGDAGILYFQFNHLAELTLKRKLLDEYSRAIERDPTSASAYLARGKILVELFQHELAVGDFTQAIALAPRPVDALVERAKVNFHLGHATAAASDLERAIELDPTSGKAYLVRGVTNAVKGDAEGALRDTERASRLDARNGETFYALGNLYAALQRYDDAIKAYEKATVLSPDHADAHVNRGVIFALRNMHSRAMEEYDKALVIDPDHELAYLNRARIYMAQSKHNEAMSDLEKVLNLNGANAEALVNRGLLLLENGRKMEARISFRRGCDAGSRHGCDKVKEVER